MLNVYSIKIILFIRKFHGTEKLYGSFIDGTVFTLGGTEDEAYLRQVAAYLNEKIGEVRKMDGFSRQSPEYQNLTIQLNLSDDYFKEQMRADDLKQQKEELEKRRIQLKT